MTFSVKAPRELAGYSTIQRTLREAGEHDSGAGASLAALRRRGLVELVMTWWSSRRDCRCRV